MIVKAHYSDIPLGTSLIYRNAEMQGESNDLKAVPFGRERGHDGRVSYYWVLLSDGRRIKAYPEELKKR